MPRNRVTPYECRRHEVRGVGIPPTPASGRREKVVNSRFSNDQTHWLRYPALRTPLYVPYVLLSSNPLGLQPLPLYFTCVKHMGRKGYLASARGLINGLKTRCMNFLHHSCFFYYYFHNFVVQCCDGLQRQSLHCALFNQVLLILSSKVKLGGL